MTLHATRKDEIENLGYVSTTDLWKGYRVRQSSNGGGDRLIWGDNQASLVAGLEYSHDRIRQTETVQQNAVEQIDRTLDRWAGFVNGAFSIGKLTLLPGLRLDHTGVSGDNLSYTLGATWQLTEKTVVRGYGARGYSLPQINSGNGLQKIWTAQAGVESSEIPFVWLKGALFYSEIWDIEEWDYANNTTTLKEQVKQGYELEARSVPLHGFSLSGGYTFIDARDRATRERLTDVPEHSLKLALSYRHDKVGLSGALTGNYVWWYSSDATARYKAMTWDLSLTQKLPSLPLVAPELFFTGHNLFNGSQYQTELYKNTGRWLEGGVRFRF
jgi:vitamin B12 transporter